MRTRLAALVLLVGVGATACVTSEVTTNDPTDAAGVTPVASPDVDPTAPTTAVDAEAAIAWDALADRFLLLAEEATLPDGYASLDDFRAKHPRKG